MMASVPSLVREPVPIALVNNGTGVVRVRVVRLVNLEMVGLVVVGRGVLMVRLRMVGIVMRGMKGGDMVNGAGMVEGCGMMDGGVVVPGAFDAGEVVVEGGGAEVGVGRPQVTYSHAHQADLRLKSIYEQLQCATDD